MHKNLCYFILFTSLTYGINQNYYDFLPSTTEDDPTLTFMRSRCPENMSLEESFIEMIAQATRAQTIVETGTYLGDSTEKMARHFACVHSIELGKELFEKAQKRFKKQKNIQLHQGDSVQLLPGIIKQLKGKTVFFLDAHFSMGITACGDENTPILTELAIIQKAGLKDATIIIDDARMFYHPLSTVDGTFMADYPTIHDIVEQLLLINPDYQLAIVYDTLIAFSPAESSTVSPIVQAATISRLSEHDGYATEHLLEAELCIARAAGEEKEALAELATRWVEPWSRKAGLSRHYALWYGLILMEQEKYPEAFAYFEEAKKRGLRDWRLDWYCAMAQTHCFFDIR